MNYYRNIRGELEAFKDQRLDDYDLYAPNEELDRDPDGRELYEWWMDIAERGHFDEDGGEMPA